MRQTLNALWQRRLVRVLAGVTVLVVAFAAQYYLANVPLPVDVSTIKEFSPASVRLGQEELIIEAPLVNSKDGLLLSHVGQQNEVVDINFDSAQLDKDTHDALAGLGDNPPTTPARLDYMTQNPKQGDAGEPCRTQIELRATDKPPAELHFFQLEEPGLDRFRYLGMKATGGDLNAALLTEVADDGTEQSPGCRKLLRVGALEEIINGSFGLTLLVPAEQSFRFHFRRLFANSPLWATPNDFFQPFALGATQIGLTGTPPMQARAVVIKSLRGGAGSAPVLSARSTDGGALLDVSELKLGSDQLQITVKGRGWVQADGANLGSFNLLERVQQYPILSTIFGALNAGLLALIVRLIFGKRASDPQKTAQ